MIRELAAQALPQVPAAINGDALAVAVVAFLLAFMPWTYRHLHRQVSWVFAFAAAATAVAIPAWTGSLAGLTAHGPGLAALFAVDIVTGWAFWHEAIRNPAAKERKRIKREKKERAAAADGGGKARASGGQVAIPAAAMPGDAASNRPRSTHNEVRTNVIAMIFGTVAVITYGSASLMIKAGTGALAGTLAALAQSHTSISSGKAAAAVPPGHRLEILLAGAVVLIIVWRVMATIHNRRTGQKDRKGQKNRSQGRQSPFGPGGIQIGS